MATHDRMVAVCVDCGANFAALRTRKNEIHVIGTPQCPDCGGEQFIELTTE